MEQLIVSLDDNAALSKVKNAIGMLKGVSSVKVSRLKQKPNATTIKAINEAKNGDTIVCDTMDDYLKLVGYGIQD